MDVVDDKRPLDAVARMNPKLTGKKGVGFLSLFPYLLKSLDARESMPVFGLNRRGTGAEH